MKLRSGRNTNFPWINASCKWCLRERGMCATHRYIMQDHGVFYKNFDGYFGPDTPDRKNRHDRGMCFLYEHDGKPPTEDARCIVCGLTWWGTRMNCLKYSGTLFPL